MQPALNGLQMRFAGRLRIENYEGTDGKSFALGLVDPAALAVSTSATSPAARVVPVENYNYDPKLEGPAAKFEGGSSIQSAPSPGINARRARR
jgi:hypothetical protein